MKNITVAEHMMIMDWKFAKRKEGAMKTCQCKEPHTVHNGQTKRCGKCGLVVPGEYPTDGGVLYRFKADDHRPAEECRVDNSE